MILDKLPNSFYKVEDVVKLLKKHSKKNPVFDLQVLETNLKYMQTARNFTMPVVTKDANGKIYSPGSIYAVVADNRDYEVLRWEIMKTIERVEKKIVNPDKEVKKVTTQVDDLNGSTSRVRVNKESKTKYGDKMVSMESTNEKVDKA